MSNTPCRRSPRYLAGWWPAVLLGVLLVVPAVAGGAEPDRRERDESPRASSRSRPSSPPAKASSSSSRPSPRSQPRASSVPRAPRSQPRASSAPRAPRSQPRAVTRPQPSRRSDPPARSRASRPRVFEPEARQRNAVKRPSRPHGSSAPAVESVRPIGRTEVSPPNDAPSVRSGGYRWLKRPRYRTPAERAADDRPVAVERRRPADTGGERRYIQDTEAPDASQVGRRRPRGLTDAGGEKRYLEIREAEPEDPGMTSVARRKRPREHPEYGDRGHRGGHRGHHGGYRRHRHHYGCGHYGYSPGYDPYAFGYGFSYYSPFSYWGLGYWAPEVHVYGSGSSSAPLSSGRYREVGQGALDLNLRPKKAEIYVDGTYVGVADQYDGFPTYLWLEAGTYEIAFYKEGYETVFRQYTVYPGVTIDVSDRMRPGEAVLPVPAGTDPAFEPVLGASTSETPAAVPSGGDGRIAIAATPGDAAVYLDGHFVGTAAEISELGAGLIVESGDHVVDVVRPGYENQSVPVSVAVDERVDLKLDLNRP